MSSDGMYLTECDISKWPSVWLWFDGVWLEAIPNEYLLDASVAQDRSVCVVGFIGNSDDFWLLGDVFMRGFYSVHDMGNQKIGFVPHSNSDKRKAEPEAFDSIRNEALGTGSNNWVLYAVLAFVVFVVGAVYEYMRVSSGGQVKQLKKGTKYSLL